MHHLLNGLKKEAPGNIARFLSFTQYVSKLRNEILVAQQSTHLPDVAPIHLPDSVVMFLVESCAMKKEDVEDCWQLMREVVWEGYVPNDADVDAAFEKFGKERGFGEFEVEDLKFGCFLFNI